MKSSGANRIFITLLIAGLISPACAQPENKVMIPIGPEIQADLVIYFKAGVSSEQVSIFWNEVLSNPHSSGRGTWPKDGIGEMLAVPPVQGHEGVAVRFTRTATETQRERVRAGINSSPLVYRVLENIAPKDIKYENHDLG